MTDPTDPPISPNYEDPRTAPVIYFDLAPTFGTLAGVVQIELASRILIPTADGGASAKFVAVGRLRCSPTAARYLREALDRSLEMIERPATNPPEGGPAGATGRLN
jgi:hypothetical protein